LFRKNGLDMMSKDTEVINKIFNLLTENCQAEKIEGIISMTEIIKYGGEIEDNEAKQIFLNIINWWESNGF
jgi:hypothetical protein